MKQTVKQIIIVIIAVLFSSLVFAQDHGLTLGLDIREDKSKVYIVDSYKNIDNNWFVNYYGRIDQDYYNQEFFLNYKIRRSVFGVGYYKFKNEDPLLTLKIRVKVL